MSTPMPIPSYIAKITTPLLIGHLLQWALFGVLSVQVYIYYLAFPNDPLRKKLLVYGVYAIELVQAILLARLMYLQFGAGYGNLDALYVIPAVAWFGIPILSSIVAAVVQIFYAYRTKILADSYLIPGVIVLLALLQLGGGITFGVLAAKTPVLRVAKVSDGGKSYIAFGIMNGGSAACDVLIAVYMTYLLLQRKSGLKQTRRLMQKIMRLTIGTGMLTAAIAIINLVLFLIPKKPSYYATTTEILGKLYSNTMMVVLNSRMSYAYDTVSNEVSSVVTFQRSAFFTSQDPSAMHEQQSDPLEHPLEDFKAATLSRLEDGMESVAVDLTEAVPKNSTERQH